MWGPQKNRPSINTDNCCYSSPHTSLLLFAQMMWTNNLLHSMRYVSMSVCILFWNMRPLKSSHLLYQVNLHFVSYRLATCSLSHIPISIYINPFLWGAFYTFQIQLMNLSCLEVMRLYLETPLLITRHLYYHSFRKYILHITDWLVNCYTHTWLVGQLFYYY